MSYFFVYVLQSQTKDDWLYVGYSLDYKRRYREHCNGEVQSTKHYKPFKLIFLEVYVNIKDAKRREKYLKTTKGRTTLRKMLKETLVEA